MSDILDRLGRDGWVTISTPLSDNQLHHLRRSGFAVDRAGTRCLLDEPAVQDAVGVLRRHLQAEKVLGTAAVAIQAIAFDKTGATNWKVTWHQDLQFPLARPATAPGYELPTVKDHVAYARPPLAILETLLAVRVHLDDCGPDNGPLRVAPGSHRLGIIPSTQLRTTADRCGEHVCTARCGEALLMRPLVLHASSPTLAPSHRRVLHLVFHDGPSPEEPWHRVI